MSGTLYTSIYDLLRKLLVQSREELGVTQSTLAEMIGKTQSFVSKYERGERRLDVVEFLLIARKLKKDPHELLDQLIGLADDEHQE